jgi:hypothetical protein
MQRILVKDIEVSTDLPTRFFFFEQEIFAAPVFADTCAHGLVALAAFVGC